MNKTAIWMGSILMAASAATFAFAAPQDTTKTTKAKKTKKAKETTSTTATTAPAVAPATKMTTATTATTATKMAKAPTATQTPAQIADAKGKGMVWMNTGSGTKAYHKSDSKYYGATKEGKFVSEADAKAAGYHLAGNEK